MNHLVDRCDLHLLPTVLTDVHLTVFTRFLFSRILEFKPLADLTDIILQPIRLLSNIRFTSRFFSAFIRGELFRYFAERSKRSHINLHINFLLHYIVIKRKRYIHADVAFFGLH